MYIDETDIGKLVSSHKVYVIPMYLHAVEILVHHDGYRYRCDGQKNKVCSGRSCELNFFSENIALFIILLAFLNHMDI